MDRRTENPARQLLERLIELSRPRQISLGLLLLATGFAVLSWSWHHRGIPWELASGDALEYAEMGRRVATGEGFTTGVIYPAELWLGTERDHPAVKFPPLWPALLATAFSVLGAQDAVVHGVVGALFVALVCVATAFATRMAGRGAGVVALIAVATSPVLLTLSIDGLGEMLFALTVTSVFLLCALEAPAVAIGAACGLAYLTRYNGAVLLPVALGLLAYRRVPLRSLAICALGFGLVVLPWWIRNTIVAGSPFYSLLNLNLYIQASSAPAGSSLFFALDPDAAAAAAGDPIDKAIRQLPILLSRLPFASANLAAFIGVLFACWRRDALSVGLATCGAATLVVASLALPMGRYFAPFLPPMYALGVAGWVRYGGRFRAPMLALLLLAPILPSFPAPLSDLEVARSWVRDSRGRAASSVDDREARCLQDRDLVVARQAARIAWQHDAIAIYAPAQPERVWQIATAQHARLVQLRDPRRAPVELFIPLPECGPDWYTPASPRDSNPGLLSTRNESESKVK